MHGEDLHARAAGRRVGDVDLAGRQAVLGLLGGVEVGQQRGDRRGAARRGGAGGEVGHDLGERVEVRAARRPGPRGGLDVEEQDALHVGDEVDQRRGDPAAQHRELVREVLEPLEPDGGVARRGTGVVERVDQARPLGVLAGQRGGDGVGAPLC